MRISSPTALAIRLGEIWLVAQTGVLVLGTGCRRADGAIASTRSAGAGWITYLHDLQRSGQDSSQPVIASPRVVWRSKELDGDVFAEPLVYGGQVYLATENNTVYAFDAGSGRRSWMRHLAPAVSGKELPCGMLPTVGITSTPVIDVSASLLYAVALVQPSQYHLFGLGLASGEVNLDRPLDLEGGDPRVYGQRGALSLGADGILIPFGGRNGDCGDYHGLLFSVPPDQSRAAHGYRVPSTRGAGLWSTGGAVVDRSGAIWLTTGNSFSEDKFDFGNTVLKLSSKLRLQESYAPREWARLNHTDDDLGSISPTLVGSSLVFQSGKAGFGYLLDASRLGGIGGERFSARVCNAAFGAAVYVHPLLYVPCYDGLIALRVDAAAYRFSFAWRTPRFHSGTPIFVGDRVWVLDTEGGSLYAFDMNGKLTFGAPVGRASRFAAPSAGFGCVFAASRRQLIAVGGPAPPSPQLLPCRTARFEPCAD